MSRIIKQYLSALLQDKKREDGRGVFDYRDITININPIAAANGSAHVRLGQTEVIVGVKLGVGEPFPDTPNEGILIVNAELSPLASPDFEPGPPKPEAIELARVVDRGIRESKAIDVGKLCITEGEKVWSVFIDIYPINDDGNLLDAASLGAIVALKNAVFPKYDKKADKVAHKELTSEKLPIKRIPILCTFGKINSAVFIDPTRREEQVFDARLSIATTADGNACAMQKGRDGVFTEKEVYDMISMAIEKGNELRKLVK